MWQPAVSWRPLPGAGPGNDGVWLCEEDQRTWVVKRLRVPAREEPHLRQPEHAGYWRREAEVALSPASVDGPGLVAPEFGPVEEDDEGLVVRSALVVGTPPPGPFVARALGRFAGAAYDVPPWASRRLLADRLDLAARRGGWPTLARTTLADVTDRLWQRRGHWLDAIGAGPQGRLHGDATPGNFLDARGDAVVAVDWQCFGVGPVGTDLGYYSLSSREEFEVLLEAFLDGAGLREHAEAVELAATVTAVYSVLSRAEWALSRAARGEGALAGKFTHPAVAPYLRAVQRQAPRIERLL